MTLDQLIPIGTIVATHGIKGELLCNITNSSFDDIPTDYIVVEIDGTLIPFYIEQYRWKSNNGLLIMLHNINSQQEAQSLVQHAIYLSKESGIDETNSMDYNQLIGYHVKNQQDNIVGTIQDIDFITPDNAILQLENDLILPLHPDLVQHIDSTQHIIHMIIPEGL